MSASRASLTALMAGALLVAATHPGVALACTVCGAAEDNANSFLLSTLVLSVLPLAMIFGGGYALYYVSRHPELLEG